MAKRAVTTHVIKIFLPLYLIAYVITAFFWRSYVVWKRTGVNPVVFKGSDSAHDFIGRVFKVLFAVVVAVVVIHAFIPSLKVGDSVRFNGEYVWNEKGRINN